MSEEENDGAEMTELQISLDSLIETLQIVGLNEASTRFGGDNQYGSIATSSARGSANAFNSRFLGTSGICRFSYDGVSGSLRIILEETGVTTTCNLNTYEPEYVDDIPFQRNAVAMKIIMRAGWLQDAVTELSATNPTRLTIIASPEAPFFALASAGPHGSATVEFSKDPQLLETFNVPGRVMNTYKYSMIKGASRAMAMATKVSIRGDAQGVLNLQFMIETEGGSVSFVDFNFVAYIQEEGDDYDEDGDGDGGESE